MNRLSRTQRAQILTMLVEGVSMRSASRMVESVTRGGREIGTSINTVTKLLEDAGEAAAAFHDEHVRNVRSEHVQMDEIWAFVYAKQRNVETARKAPEGAGDAWTWTAIDADTKLIISWRIGLRNSENGNAFLQDLGSRLANRTQLTSDGLFVYPDAVEQVFGADVDFAQLVKLYANTSDGQRRYSSGECIGAVKRPVTGRPDPKHISTSYVERQNLNVRMGVRRFTRLTNAFSKKLANHAYHVALYTWYYNFARIHSSLRVTPAMAAGLTDTLYKMDDLVGLIEARTPPPGPRGPYRKHKRPNRRKRR